LSWIAVVYLVYAVVLLLGGVMGFVKAKSAPSLIAGIVSGTLAVVAKVLLDLHHPRSGLGLGFALSVAMIAFFFGRFQRTKKAMPSLAIVALSALVLIATLARLAMAQGHHG
jgi:uncharacterized membrane protein (UPF0136 family)